MTKDKKRRCLFCGKTPQKKTSEHVIPMWLIKRTGDPKRIAYLGIDWNSDEFSNRKFSFDSFVFPACKSCNETYGELENKSKRIVEKMLKDEKVAAEELDRLMDWFDKVRVGIWLGLMELNKNFLAIDPYFAISQRNALHDRALVIFRGTQRLSGLTIYGPDSPIFQYMPSCFGLRINHLFFLNASSVSLVSKQLGLPFPEKKVKMENGVSCQLSPATERLHVPLLPIPSLKSACRKIIQPFKLTDIRNQADSTSIYDTTYTRDFFEQDSNRGRILEVTNSTFSLYPTDESLNWRSPVSMSTNRLVYDFISLTANWQESLWNQWYEETEYPSSKSKVASEHQALKLHRILIENYLSHVQAPPDLSTFD